MINVGSPRYVAPEVSSGKYTNSCDIWSLGVTLYYLLNGYHPFQGKSYKELVEKIQAGKYVIPAGLGRHASNLIVQML